MSRDPHETLSPSEARSRGCTCEFGCRACGSPLDMMSACHSWVPCQTDSSKIGRAPDDQCPLSALLQEA